jgi:hypothetical protein
MGTIVKKVMMIVDLGADNPSGSIKQGVYALKSKGELDTNENGDYGLTSAGREFLKEKVH